MQMESLVIFVVILMLLITLSGPSAFLLTTRKVQTFTSANGALNIIRRIIAGLFASAGILLAVVTGISVSGVGLRIFFLCVIALNVFAIIREIKYALNRRENLPG